MVIVFFVCDVATVSTDGADLVPYTSISRMFKIAKLINSRIALRVKRSVAYDVRVHVLRRKTALAQPTGLVVGLVFKIVVFASVARVRLGYVVAVHHLKACVAQALRDLACVVRNRVLRALLLAVVGAVAEEIIGTGHAFRACSHKGGPALARILPRQAVGPLLRGTGVLLPDDAKVIDAAVFAARAVVVVPIYVGAVVEETGPASDCMSESLQL
jgi:hypothetical protein